MANLSDHLMCARCNPELISKYGLRPKTFVCCSIHGYEDALNVTSLPASSKQ